MNVYKYFRNHSSHQSNLLEAFKTHIAGFLIDAAINTANDTINDDTKGSIGDNLNFELLPSYQRLRLMKSFLQDLSKSELKVKKKKNIFCNFTFTNASLMK